MFNQSSKEAMIGKVSGDDTITLVTQTSEGVLTSTDTFVVVTNGAATTVTLPSVADYPHTGILCIYITDATTYNVTIQEKAVDNAGGFTNFVIDQNKVLLVFMNVANRDWVLLGAKNDGVALPTIADIAV